MLYSTLSYLPLVKFYFVRRRAETRVITIFDLERGIRDLLPESLGQQAARAGREAILALSEGSAAPSVDGEPADDQVRLCVRRLQGTRTLMRKNFRVSPGSLLLTVFTRACERLRVRESSVVFVHDGVILSGRQRAGTLVSAGSRAVQVFAVCKRAWACKQRAAARRGLVSASHQVAWCNCNFRQRVLAKWIHGTSAATAHQTMYRVHHQHVQPANKIKLNRLSIIK